MISLDQWVYQQIISCCSVERIIANFHIQIVLSSKLSQKFMSRLFCRAKNYNLRRPEADWYRGVWGAEPPREWHVTVHHSTAIGLYSEFALVISSVDSSWLQYVQYICSLCL